MRNNQSQQSVRSSALYPSASKGSIFVPNKSLIPNSSIPPIPYNLYGLRQQPSSQTARQSIMSKSSVIKPDNNFQSFIKETKEKFFRMQKRLYGHEQQIQALKSKSCNPSLDTSGYSTEAQFKFQNKMMNQIQRIRQQINNEYLRKDAFEFKQNRFQMEILDKFINKKDLGIKLQEVKNKTNHELQRVFDSLRNQLQNSIHQVHDINRVVFSRIQKDMSQMKSQIDEQRFHLNKLNQQVQLQGQSLYPGNKKYFGGPKIVKYQQVLQKVGINGHSGQEIVVNQCVYYLDRDGYLLDQGGYYLVNKMDQQIQLDQKQLSILRKNNILF